MATVDITDYSYVTKDIMRTRLLTPAIALAAVALLAGCTASANLTVPASSVADEAAKALEEQVGSLPEVDCGDAQVKLVNGTTVDCLLTDPASGSEYDTTVTISEVDGLKYHVEVQVSETANNAAPTDEPTEGAATVTPFDLAEVAEGALEEQYGARPTVTCIDTTPVALEVGTAIDCDLLESKSGAAGIATITITAVDGLKYSIDVQVRDA